MTSPASRMHLGVFSAGTGNHVAGWRHPGASRTGEDVAVFKRIAQTAERGLLDMVFVSDNLVCSLDDQPGFMARLEPFTNLSALSAVTTHVGLVGTVSTTYGHPFHIARALASLDHISNGRAGWNVVTTSSPEAAANFGRAQPIDHDRRYEMAEEFVQIVKGLWDSWEAEARIADAESGVYVDRAKVHALEHRGRHYAVRGPLNASRCPQGQPVIVQAGASESGVAFAARHAEVMFAVQQDIEEAGAFYRDVKRRVEGEGRDPAHCKILPGLMPVVGRTPAEAKAKLEALARHIDEANAMRTMTERIGHDLSGYPLDGPVPELPLSEHVHGYSRVLLVKAKRDKLRLRDLYNLFAVARGYLVAVGSPEQVADLMQEWFEARACDGFMLLPAHFPEAFDDVVDLVIPELQRRGLFRRRYEGSTLRSHFGLPEPPNRYA